jgi:hypothetical protein
MPSANREPVMIDERLDSLERWRDEVNQKLVDAFPAGDVHGHRRYHELMIEQIEERRRLRRAVMEKTVAGLVWGTLATVAVACWHYLKALLKG